MTPERWQKIDELFQVVVELDPIEREPFLDSSCAGDEELRREVKSLLDSDEYGASFIDAPAFGAAATLLTDIQPALCDGQQFGQYQIISLVGRGGMGEVYLALDEKLKRNVALKLLPTDYTADKDRLRLFQQEAQAASALNHPNILTIHELGEVNGRQFIATEFVDGETLRERMKRAQVSLDAALDIAIQVTSALAAAHRAGIIHRDIKPENIMLRPDGYVKVVDFGLVKLTHREEQSSGARVADLSENSCGLVMGTVRYMSPEQAKGLSVDSRTDIFSLGVVLYEILSGQPAFKAESVKQLVHALQNDELRPLQEFVPTFPEELERMVSRAVAKSRTERYQSAEDLLFDLKVLRQRIKLIEAPELGIVDSARSVSTAEVALRTSSTAQYLASRVKQHKVASMLGLVTIAALIIGVPYPLLRYFKRSSHQLSLIRLPTIGKGISSGRFSSPVAISPDGNSIVYAAESAGSPSLVIRQISAPTGRDLVTPKVAGTFVAASFSPKGNEIFYVWSETSSWHGDLYKVPVAGGPPVKVSEDIILSFALSPDAKKLAYWRQVPSTENALFTANIDGSDERKISSWDVAVSYGYLAWSPDGKMIACHSVSANTGGHTSLVAIQVEDGKEKNLASKTWENNTGPIAWLSDGSGLLVVGKDEFSGSSQIWQVDYPSGEVRRITNDSNEYRYLSLTRDSHTLVTVQSEVVSRIWVAKNGDTSGARQITFTESGATGFTWTAEGRIVFVSGVSGNQDIWIMNEDGSHQTQLTIDPHNDFYPSVSPDNRYVVFTSSRTGRFNIWRMDLDGRNPTQLTNGTTELFPSVTPDGQWVVYSSFNGKRMALWKVSINGGGPIQLTDGANAPAVSPDGRLIACLVGPKIALIPLEGGQPLKTLERRSTQFRWTPDGRALTFLVTEKGVSNLVNQSLISEEANPVTGFNSDRIFDFAWSRDGRLVYSRGVQTSDIVLMKNF